MIGLGGVLVTLLVNGYRERAQSRRKSQIDRVNQQLSALYAPLFAISRAGEDLWISQGKPLSDGLATASRERKSYAEVEDQLNQWLKLMRLVYARMNEERLRLITTQYHLLTLDDLVRNSSVYAQLAKHTYEFQLLMEEWDGDLAQLWNRHGFDAFTPSTPFPGELIEAAAHGLDDRLKRQRELLFVPWRTRFRMRFSRKPADNYSARNEPGPTTT
jgi:hypothetical protein